MVEAVTRKLGPVCMKFSDSNHYGNPVAVVSLTTGMIMFVSVIITCFLINYFLDLYFSTFNDGNLII